ncbi:M48 family metallopeptidase, partial [Porphyromonas loveana]
NKSALLQTVVGQAYGIGSQVLVTLPYNRKQEYEADKIGLIFMAMAGYNPNAALTFWQKMSAQSGGGQQADFFSTHPSDANRVAAIRQYLPEAMKYYKGK